MSYLALTIPCPDAATKDIRLAQLSAQGFEGFEEKGLVLVAYQQMDPAQEAALRQWLSQEEGLTYEIQTVEEQNWNALWESNFEPVVVGDFCAIRADFHPSLQRTQYEIEITPKMSFGTGHHATTHLMIEAMQGLEMKGKKVLDFGTGTGVLAILAHRMGAAEVEAIDHDVWSIENAKENFARNHCGEISLYQADAIPGQRKYDLILANINRHILLQEMRSMHSALSDHGQILMSGLLASDQSILAASADLVGLELKERRERDSWICLRYTQKP